MPEENIMRQVAPIVTKQEPIRYVALGDSYTKGEGVKSNQSWPSLLTAHLRSKWINITLVANPAQSGWTTRQVLELELPIVRNSSPNFATLLVGTNDVVQGIDAKTFRSNYAHILDDLLKTLPQNRILVITTPDFTISQVGKEYGTLSKTIARYNTIMKEEVAKRNLTVVDIYPLSQEMAESDFSEDSLHPSEKGYRKWEQEIFKAAYSMLNQ